jgi:hypothetical protein
MNPVPDQFSYARNFRDRKRPPLAIFVVSGILTVVIVAVVFLFGVGLALEWVVTPLVIFVVVVSGWIQRSQAAPNCPKCNQNITTCRAVHCHLCGRPLEKGSCEHCGVHTSWQAITRPLSDSAGNSAQIGYCPNCGVWLDTDLRRWQSG